MSLQTRLEQAKKDKALATETADKEIDRIKAQIEAEKKPTVKHGMVIQGNYGSPIIVIGHGKDARRYNSDGSQCAARVDGVASHGVLVDDIFDDLKAMQEDVTEFEVKDSDSGCTSRTINACMLGGDVILSVKRDYNNTKVAVKFDLDDFDSFILKLRQLQATIRRKNER